MKISFFQTAYNWFKNLQLPAWLRPIVAELNDIMIAVLKKAGESYIHYLEDKITEASFLNMSSSEKLKFVLNAAKSGGMTAVISLKDSQISALINYLVVKMKAHEAIK